MPSASRKYSATVSADSADAKSGARRLGHLSVDERRARLAEVVHVDDAALLEFDPEVVALARAFAHAPEHRDAAVLEGDVVNQLHDDDGLADARAAEETDLAALQVRFEQIDDLDARLEHLELGRLILERRRCTMNRPAFFGVHRPVGKIDRLAEHVQHAAERLGSNGDRNPLAQIQDLHPALHAVGRLHRHRAHAVLAEVLLDLANDVDRAGRTALRFDVQRVVDGRQVAGLELDVHDRTDHLNDFAVVLLSHLFIPSPRACLQRFRS